MLSTISSFKHSHFLQYQPINSYNDKDLQETCNKVQGCDNTFDKISFRGSSSDEFLSILNTVDQNLNRALSKGTIGIAELDKCIEPLLESSKYLWKVEPKDYDKVEKVYDRAFNLLDKDGQHPQTRLYLLHTCLIPINYELKQFAKAKILEKKANVIADVYFKQNEFDLLPLQSNAPLHSFVMLLHGSQPYTDNGKTLFVDLIPLLKNYTSPWKAFIGFDSILSHYPGIPNVGKYNNLENQDIRDEILMALTKIKIKDARFDANKYARSISIHNNDEFFCEKLKNKSPAQLKALLEETLKADSKNLELIEGLSKSCDQKKFQSEYFPIITKYGLNQDFRELIQKKTIQETMQILEQIKERELSLYANIGSFLTNFQPYIDNFHGDSDLLILPSCAFVGSLIEELLHSSDASNTYSLLLEFKNDTGFFGNKKYHKRKAWKKPEGLKDLVLKQWVSHHLVEEMRLEIKKLLIIDKAVNRSFTPDTIKKILKNPKINPNYKLTALRNEYNKSLLQILRGQTEETIENYLKHAFFIEASRIERKYHEPSYYNIRERKHADPDLVNTMAQSHQTANEGNVHLFSKYAYLINASEYEELKQNNKKTLKNNPADLFAQIPEKSHNEQKADMIINSGRVALKLYKSFLMSYALHGILNDIWPDNWLTHINGLTENIANSSFLSSLPIDFNNIHSSTELINQYGHPLYHLTKSAKAGIVKTTIKSILQIEEKIKQGQKLDTVDLLEIVKAECKKASIIAAGFTLFDTGVDQWNFAPTDDKKLLALLNWDNIEGEPQIKTILEHLSSRTITAADKEKLFESLYRIAESMSEVDKEKLSIWQKFWKSNFLNKK